MKSDDTEKYVAKLLWSKNKAEASEWLRRSKYHFVGELKHEASVALVDELYQLGAIQVVAVTIEGTPPYESTDRLIVFLPDDEKARRALFAWNNTPERSMGFEADVDHGQEHLFVWFD